MKTLALSIAVLLSLVISGCGDFACSPGGEMRCDGNTVEMCTANGGHWEAFQQCGANSFGSKCFDSPAGCFGYVGIACCN